jgi:pimeloyl-ACP methyl ester carboxylesterase
VRGDGPALLLVHGFGGAKEDFFDHLDELALTHRVATFDHRGHGASDKPESVDAYSLERLRADTLQVADALGFDQYVLLGHSMGGMVTRRIATDHPHRVIAHIFMDTSPGPLPDIDPALLDLGATIALDEGKESLKNALDALGSPLDNPAYERVLVERQGYQEFVDKKWDDLSHIMWAALARAIAYQNDDLEALRGLRCPVLVIVGELDRPFLRPSAAITEAVRGARLAVIEGAGHSPQFENPNDWYAEITKFLAEVAD